MAEEAQPWRASMVPRPARKPLMKTQADVAGDIATAMEKNMAAQARAKNPKGEIYVVGVKSAIRTINSVNAAVTRGRIESAKDMMTLRKTILDAQKAEHSEQVRLRQLLEKRYREQHQIRRQQLKADEELRRMLQEQPHLQPGLIDRHMKAGYYEAAGGSESANHQSLLSDIFELFAWQLTKKLGAGLRKLVGSALDGLKNAAEKEFAKVAEKAAAEEGEKIAGRLAATVGVPAAVLVGGTVLSYNAAKIVQADKNARQAFTRENDPSGMLGAMSGDTGFAAAIMNQTEQNDADAAAAKSKHDSGTDKSKDDKGGANTDTKPKESAPPPVASTPAKPAEVNTSSATSDASPAMIGSVEMFATESARNIGNITVHTMEVIDEKFREFIGWQKAQQNWVKPAKAADKDDLLALRKRGIAQSGITALPSDGGNTPTPTSNVSTPPIASTPSATPPDGGAVPQPLQGKPHVAIREWDGKEKGTGGPGTLSAPAMRSAISNLHKNPLSGLQTTLPNPLTDFKSTNGNTPAQSPMPAVNIPGADVGQTPSSWYSKHTAMENYKTPAAWLNPGKVLPMSEVDPSLQFGATPKGVNFSAPGPSSFGDMKSVFFGATRPTNYHNPYIFVPPELQNVNPNAQPAIAPSPLAATQYGDIVPMSPMSAMPMREDMFTQYKQSQMPDAPTPPPVPKVSPTDDLPGIRPAQKDREVDPAWPNISRIPQNTTDQGLHTLQTADDM